MKQKFPWKLFLTVMITAMVSMTMYSSQYELLSLMSILIAFVGGMIYMDMVYKQDDALSEKEE